MPQTLSLQQLESFLWESTDILRGSLDAADYRENILGMLFLKRLSDVFEDKKQKVIQHYIDNGRTKEQAKELARNRSEYVNTFFVPENANWSALTNVKEEIGQSLDRSMLAIEEHNSELKNVLTSIDFGKKTRLSNAQLRDLVLHFSKCRLLDEDFECPDILGKAYEYLIKMFADSAGRKGSGFYTPREVVKLMVSLLEPSSGMSVYDPTVGAGGMLVQSRNYLKDIGKDVNLSLYGQEVNQGTWTICRMNMFLQGESNVDIRHGDTLRNPKHTEANRLITFDRVISHPPFSLKEWGGDELSNDTFGRFKYGIPPRNSGDFAFIQHTLATMNESGRAVVVLPHGPLHRAGKSELDIRRGMLEDDVIEAVIGLPAGIFYGTGIPTCLLILNKCKGRKQRGKVLFVDASNGFKSNKWMMELRGEDSEKILKAYGDFESIGSFSRIVTVDEILKDKYCRLTIRLYIDDSEDGKRLESLIESHSNFKHVRFNNRDVVKGITSVGAGKLHPYRENKVYFPRSLSKSVVSEISDVQTHSSYLQVELNPDEALAEYFELFFSSELGRLILKKLPIGTYLPALSVATLREVQFPLPPLELQKEIVETQNKLNQLKKFISEYVSELTVNPVGFQNVRQQADKLLESLSLLSDSERVRAKIKLGESERLEFKRSFSLNIKMFKEGGDYKNKKNWLKQEMAVLKTLSAFMNTHGGTLLIGVTDRGAISGVNDEINEIHKGSEDSFLKFFKDKFNNRVGANFHKNIHFKFIEFDNKTVIEVDCETSATPCFIDETEFYIRTPASSDTLVGKKLIDYVNTHFKGNV
ncbi:N-6 DNA methylase [Vibrio sp. MED222]|uniref:N-6 DNA methylase n=1 Tax=Vibrio sp. MED222 TaxID=314290 RepID=UPI000068A881|nr:N-6 DNA methylase [Vibrio sp. MED222]EAQ54716.1 Type I restriction-modification system M subunit [Vibrio sp. MED222]